MKFDAYRHAICMLYPLQGEKCVMGVKRSMTVLVGHLVIHGSNLTQAGVQGGTSECSAPTSNPDVPNRNLLNMQGDHAEQPVKNLPHPAASTCCLRWSAVMRNNCFLKKCMFSICKRFVWRYRKHCVIKMLIFGPNEGASYAYAYIIFIKIVCTIKQYMINVYTYFFLSFAPCILKST